MFCPKCGKGEQTPNVYCRNCGEWLPDVDRLAKLQTRRGFGGGTPEQNIKATVILSCISAAFALFIAVALYCVLAGLLVSNAIIAAAAAFSLCIAGYQISNIIIAAKLHRRLVRRTENQMPPEPALDAPARGAAALPAADTSELVRTPAASVTENTTGLLEPAQKAKRNI